MKNKETSKKVLLFVLGAVTMLAGVTLILKWWAYVGVLFKGAIGIGLALAGLVMLFLAK